MAYQVLTTTDVAYQQTMRYIQERCPAELRVASPRRHLLGVEELTAEVIRELKAMGAEVVEDFEYAIEDNGRR